MGALCLIAATFALILALWLLWGPDRGTVDEDPATRERVEESIRKHSRPEMPETFAASYTRALSEYAPLSVLPRRHEEPCPACRSRALRWERDPKRSGVWIGYCRRVLCGMPRCDVAAGQRLDFA